jgi:hypothetical protein
MTSAVGDNASFRVHLQSLVDFARELETQLEALARPVDRLSVLGGQPLALGEFDEALSLRQRHGLAAQQMHDLVSTVRDVVGFADDVTHAIANGYTQHDQQIAGAFQDRGTQLAGSTVTIAGVAASGAVTPAAVTPAPVNPAPVNPWVANVSNPTGTIYQSAAAAGQYVVAPMAHPAGS